MILESVFARIRGSKISGFSINKQKDYEMLKTVNLINNGPKINDFRKKRF